MEGTTGSGAQVDRTKGNLAAMEAYPNLKLVAQNTGNFTRAEGQALMESWLKSIDKIDVLIAQNDDMALGAIDAIKAPSTPSRLPARSRARTSSSWAATP